MLKKLAPNNPMAALFGIACVCFTVATALSLSSKAEGAAVVGFCQLVAAVANGVAALCFWRQ